MWSFFSLHCRFIAKTESSDVSTHEENIVETESSEHLFDAESEPLSSLQDKALLMSGDMLFEGNLSEM
jgi:hypothetical protein